MSGPVDRHLEVGKLVDEVEVREYMPDDLEATLAALFAYRNEMFHFDFEWSTKELERFERSRWPCDWFSRATSNGRPWIFYKSPKFIDRCLESVKMVVESLEKFNARRASDS